MSTIVIFGNLIIIFRISFYRDPEGIVKCNGIMAVSLSDGVILKKLGMINIDDVDVLGVYVGTIFKDEWSLMVI